MINEEYIIEGKIDETEEGLKIENSNGYRFLLLKDIESRFELGSTVFVSSFVSDEPITYEQVQNDMALIAMGLLDENDYYYVYWSELTGSDLQENLVVGGHNVKEILTGYAGKYLVLRIYNRKAIIDEILQDIA